MIVKLTKIGSSKGIILNKQVLHTFGENVTHLELDMKDGVVVLKSYVDPHEDFLQYFKSNPGKDLNQGPVLSSDGFVFSEEDEGF